jgi:hypothetical protein
MKTQKFADSNVLETKKIKTQNWHAWINKMPPPPERLHVWGEVEVSNPGVEVALFKRQPQGINPTIILLDLFLIQRPGIWPDLVMLKPAVYEEIGRSLAYVTAQVFHQGEGIASIPVEIVQ